MFRLPLLFIATGILSFLAFHVLSLFSLGSWVGEPPRNPEGWFRIHLIVLDWGTMIAMGAVYQLLDVVLQRKLHSHKLGYLHYACFLIGSSILLIGFLRLEVSWIAAGATMTWLGICLFAWNIGQTMLLAAKWNAITVSTACAVVYLVLTGLFVILLWNAATLLGAGHFLLGSGTLFNGIVIGLMMAALVTYEAHMRDIRKHRHKGSPGSGIRWSIFCTRGLIVYVVMLLGIWFVKPDLFEDETLLILTGWIYLYGWVAMTILGYLSKIVPFLWWTHKYGPLAGKMKVPVMNDLIQDGNVKVGMAGMCGGLLLILLGIGFKVMLLVWGGGCLLSVCSILYMGLIARVFTR